MHDNCLTLIAVKAYVGISWWLMTTLLAIALPCRAQGTERGAIKGVVRSASGGAVAKAVVIIAGEGTGGQRIERQVTTGGDGSYLVSDLPAGTYVVTVDAPTLRRFQSEPVTVEAGRTVTVNVSLESFLRTPVDQPLGAAGASRTGRKTEQSDDHFVPMPDRWRLGFPPYERYGKKRGEYPYTRGRPNDPYDLNVLKGDYPIIGQNIFLNLTVASDTLLEWRRVPVPSDVSAIRPGSEEFFGRGEQTFISQSLILSADLFKGDTAFKPRDWNVRLTPVFNYNHLTAKENGIVNIDVRRGRVRRDRFVGWQEAFIEKKLADVSPNYDFTSLRLGTQNFVSDFRGFIFNDNEPGIRLFGTQKSNRNQWNLAYFAMREKDTNSGLNSFRSRHQRVGVANYFWQDFIKKGFTAQFSLHYNEDKADVHFDENDFPVRPARVGVAQPHEVRAYYLGWAGEGHIGIVNVSQAFYHAFGTDTLNPIAGQRTRINAQMAALELSIDRDWKRYRASIFWSSGDKNPRDGRARGFDAIFDAPNFAGGRNSFWNSQGIRLTQTGVTLVDPNSLLPSLRSSKIQGQANFVNPGILILNAGMDLEVTPKLRASFNLNYLRFQHTEPIELVLNQAPTHRSIGFDFGFGVRYRPYLNDNVIISLSLSLLRPSSGLRDVYEGRLKTLYAGSLGITLTY